MSVCIGAQVLAAAGRLDGRPATSHWLGLIGLRRSHPEAEWTSGVRFVHDGDVITTAGVLSGIDGALPVVERTLGAATAAEVARRAHLSGYPSASVDIPRPRRGPSDLVVGLSVAYRWDRPAAGVLQTEGVGEIELAAAFRLYTELAYLSTLVPVITDGQPIRSRHGLTFLQRTGGRAPRPPRTGTSTARCEFAGTYDVATARWVAKSLQYPTAGLDLTGLAWPWSLTLRPILLAAVTTAGVLTLLLR